MKGARWTQEISSFFKRWSGKKVHGVALRSGPRPENASFWVECTSGTRKASLSNKKASASLLMTRSSWSKGWRPQRTFNLWVSPFVVRSIRSFRPKNDEHREKQLQYVCWIVESKFPCFLDKRKTKQERQDDQNTHIRNARACACVCVCVRACVRACVLLIGQYRSIALCRSKKMSQKEGGGGSPLNFDLFSGQFPFLFSDTCTIRFIFLLLHLLRLLLFLLLLVFILLLFLLLLFLLLVLLFIFFSFSFGPGSCYVLALYLPLRKNLFGLLQI